MSDSFATPWPVARQAPLSMGFPSQECWSGLPFPSPGFFLTQELKSCHLHWQVGSLPHTHLGSSNEDLRTTKKFTECLKKLVCKIVTDLFLRIQPNLPVYFKWWNKGTLLSAYVASDFPGSSRRPWLLLCLNLHCFNLIRTRPQNSSRYHSFHKTCANFIGLGRLNFLWKVTGLCLYGQLFRVFKPILYYCYFWMFISWSTWGLNITYLYVLLQCQHNFMHILWPQQSWINEYKIK